MYRRELEVCGSYMSDRSTPRTLIRMMECKLLRMQDLNLKVFPLSDIKECVDHARKCSALQFSILEPNE